MEGNETMSEEYKVNKLISDKYREDMASIHLEVNAIHTVTKTFIEVCGNQGLEGEIINCLSMIEQSLAGAVKTIDRRRDQFEDFIVEVE